MTDRIRDPPRMEDAREAPGPNTNAATITREERTRPKAYAKCPFLLHQEIVIMGDQISRSAFLSEYEVLSLFKSLEVIEREKGLAEIDRVVSYVIFRKKRYAIIPMSEYPLHVAIPCAPPDQLLYPLQCYIIDDTMPRLAK